MSEIILAENGENDDFRALGALESAVMRAVDVAKIDPAGEFGALVELACTYARQIDRIPVDAGQYRTKVLYLGPHLTSTLKEMGLTPKGRAEIDKEMATIKAAETAKAGAEQEKATKPNDDLANLRRKRGGTA